MNKYIIDASAWVEYFEGSQIGEKVKNIVESTENSIYTNVITIAELSSFFKRKNRNFSEAKKSLLSLSVISELNTDFAEDAGVLYIELKKERTSISLVDSIVFLNGKKLNAKIVTKDEDFRGLKEVLLLR